MNSRDASSTSNERKAEMTGDYQHHYISTGVHGLDAILKGGFIKSGFYLLQGDPGSGKTTLGLQYLLKRKQEGDRVLYIAMTESRRDIEMTCRSHGWRIDTINLCDLVSTLLPPVEQSTDSIFDPSEIELIDVIKTITSEIDKLTPSHLVLDGLSELRTLAGSMLRYRRQLLSLKMFLEQRGITTLLLDDRGPDIDPHAHLALVGGSIVLETTLPQYGRARRRLYIGKVRSADFTEGFHDYEIRDAGLLVYPRLVSSELIEHAEQRMISSGITNLDQMFKGGLRTGTSAVFVGPSGVGKSTMAMQFVSNALTLGCKAAVYTFDEVLGTFLGRAERIGFPGKPGALRPYLKDRRLIARQVNPAELTPGAFAQDVRDAVDDGASIVVIDSLNGYINAMPEERFLSTHLHELVSYLNERNVITIMVVAQHGIFRGLVADFNVSYLADTILLFRYFEQKGEILRGLSVFKNRTGPHEHTMRELVISDTGLVIGDQLSRATKLATGPLYDDTAAVEVGLCQDRERT
jgi:circadian clock protein KaiC